MSTVTLIAPLSNINISVPLPLELGANLALEPIPSHLPPFLEEAAKQSFIRHPVTYNCCLVVRDAESTKDDASDLREEVEEAVLRLRLFKAGGVGFSLVLVDPDGWYDNPAKVQGTQVRYLFIGMFFYHVWERDGMLPFLNLDPDDVVPLRSLFVLSAGQRLLQKPAFRYFFRSYHEPYATDRFLSNAIGLENLLVNDTKDRSNYRYKFADRGCFLLQHANPRPDGPEVYFKDLQEIYDGRSEIVHSNEKSDWDWHKAPDIRKLQNSENYLRQLLVYILEHPTMERSGEVDKAKRLRYVDESGAA
jgi:hypothetical protein